MKVVGQMVIGPGEADRYLEETLKEFQRLTDDVIAVTCGAGEKEIEMLRRYDIRHYSDEREWGTQQNNIKTDLLARIALLKPDYVLALDADETVPTLTRESLESCLQDRISLYLYVTNLWNDEHHYSPELSFWNCRAYKLPGLFDRTFLRQPLHCGSAPPVALHVPPRDSYVPHILLHKGLMKKEDRMRKARRYEKYDPDARWKGRQYYNSLTKDGPGTPYDQTKVLSLITNFCATL